jgi:NADPH-dependent curcumin reductase CurA
MSMSRQFRLAARPEGEIKDSDFKLVTAPLPEPADGEFVVEITHVSIDPAMRGWMSAARSYLPPVEIGAVMRALAVGQVTASRHPGFEPGDWVHGPFGVQEHAVSDGQNDYKIEVTERLTPAAYLGVLGLTGLTAYFGLLDVGRLRDGDTVLVSGAAGGVGTAVGQIAKIKGATVIGVAGGPEKCNMLVEELGFDAAVDYKRPDLHDRLREHTPDRIDVLFDNVGGEILDEGLARLNRGARVVICGAISQYNATGRAAGPSNYTALLVSRATMAGFVVADYASRYRQGIAEMARWIIEERLRSVEDTVAGDIEMFPGMLARLFSGQNTGKLALELRPPRGQT